MIATHKVMEIVNILGQNFPMPGRERAGVVDRSGPVFALTYLLTYLTHRPAHAPVAKTGALQPLLRSSLRMKTAEMGFVVFFPPKIPVHTMSIQVRSCFAQPGFFMFTGQTAFLSGGFIAQGVHKQEVPQ